MSARTIVLDNGSGMCRAGFAGEKMPSSIIPSVIGRIRKTVDIYGTSNSTYLGNNAYMKAGILSLKYPIEYGNVTNWPDMEKLFNYQFFYQLRIDPEDHPILLTETSQMHKSNREKLIELMFEVYNFPLFCIQCQAVLSIFCSKSSTGLSIDSGEGCSQIVPVYEGYKIPHAVNTSKIAGKKLNEFLNFQLREKGYNFDSSSEKEIVRSIKETACYVSTDYDEDIKKIECFRFPLPDKTWITVKKERIKCPEILFRPDLLDNKSENGGIHKMLFDSINKCDVSIHNELFQRIVISGGSSMFKGFKERLEDEIAKDRYERFNVMRPLKDCRYCAWNGGSIWASMDSFNDSLISIDDYYECGPCIVHTKCL